MAEEQKKHSDEELRQKAEKILGRTNRDFSDESEYMKVIQELSVHQIELELHNEELREAREAEKEITERYIQLYDFAPSGYLTLTKDGKITEMNLVAAKMLGGERAVLRNKGFSFFLKAESRPSFGYFLTKVLEGSFSQTCEVTLESGYHVHLTGILHNDIVSLTATDITSLKKVEEEKNKLLEEVLESREKINLLLENARIGSWTWDYKSGQIWIDNSLAEILGFSKGEKRLSIEDFEKILYNDGISDLGNDFEAAIEKRIPFESVFRIKGIDEKIKYLNAKSIINFDQDDNATGLTGVCIDITRTHESFEETLIRLNDELSKSNRELQNFAYIASHDLQEPLRMVTSFVQLLQMKYGDKLDDQAHEYINFAAEGAKRMYELLNSLLAYSRIRTRQSSFQEVDMNELLKMVLDNMQIVIKEKQVEIDAENLPVIFADKNQMMQLLQNLIDNGIKFSNNLPQIRISSRHAGNFNIFKISDKGIGIEREYFERIFGIFQKLHNAVEYSGTGVGLAICKSIVERHGGEIWLESKPGKGTTFFFSIPVNPRITRK